MMVAKEVLIIALLLALVGCGMENNNPMTITETAVGQAGMYSVGISRIWQDDDGVLRATLSVWDEEGFEQDFRVAEGEDVVLPEGRIVVEQISVGNKKGSVTIRWME